MKKLIHSRGAVVGRVVAFCSIMAATASACGNVTAGGFTRVSVEVSGDESSPAPSPGPVPRMTSVPVAAPPAPAPDENRPEGEVEVDFSLVLVAEDGSAHQLGEDDIRVKIDLQGVSRAEAVDELVRAQRYTELQMIFTHVQVEVEGGLVVNGEPILGEVSVELEDPLHVNRPIDLDASEGDRVAMLVDLNAPAWLAALDPVTKTVDPAVFAALIDVVVQ